jgi:ABC-2 type transport system permease protein
MMKSLHIAWKDFNIRIKDRKGFLTMILMPLILTAILGMALSSVMGGNGGFSETNLGLYMADPDDELAEQFRTEVLSSLEFLTIKTASSEQQIHDWMDAGKIDVGLAIPKEWGKDINQGNVKEVAIFTANDKKMKASVIQSVLESYSERVKTVSVSANAVLGELTQAQSVLTGEFDWKTEANQLVANIMASGEEDIQLKEEAVGEKMVSSMQYYAAAMAVMFLLFNATMGAKSILQERRTETLARLMISPTSNGSILMGKFLGTLLFALIQMLIFYVTTTLVFNVDWGGNLLQILAIGIAYSVAVSGLSMIIAAVVSDEKTTDLISGVGIQIFAILGGSMLPIFVFPESLQMVANITPNKWALTGFLDIMTGTTWGQLMAPMTILFLTGFVSLTIGTWRLKAR